MDKYDQRTGCAVSQGTDHGVGYAQNVGTKDHSNESIMPKGCFRFEIDEKKEERKEDIKESLRNEIRKGR